MHNFMSPAQIQTAFPYIFPIRPSLSLSFAVDVCRNLSMNPSDLNSLAFRMVFLARVCGAGNDSREMALLERSRRWPEHTSYSNG